jgi:hypothetical protein
MNMFLSAENIADTKKHMLGTSRSQGNLFLSIYLHLNTINKLISAKATTISLNWWRTKFDEFSADASYMDLKIDAFPLEIPIRIERNT